MQFPESDEVVGFNLIKKVLRPTAFRRRPDFNLLEIEAMTLR